MSDDREPRPAPSAGRVRMASSGFDLAIVVGGFTAIGWWLDRKYGWTPWGVLTGAVLGVVGGLTNFLRAARVSTREALEDVERERDDG